MARGGRREGARRPFKSGVPRKKLTLAIRTDLLAQLVPQAQAKNISLADHINQLLADQLQQTAPAAAQKAPVPAKAQAPVTPTQLPEPRKIAASASAEPLPFDELLQQLDAFDRELAAPLDDEQPETQTAEPVPSYLEMKALVQKWQFGSSANRRTQEVQYWRKAYRKDKAFRMAVDHIAVKTANGMRDLLLDGLLPLSSHKEVLGLADLPPEILNRTLFQILKGQRSLKQALGSDAETFRQAVTVHARQQDSLYTRYYFFEEI